MWLILVTFLSISWLAYFYVKKARREERIFELKIRVQQRQELRNKHLDEIGRKVKEVNTETKERINSLNFDELLKSLQNGEFTCVEVLRAFQERAIKAHEKTNCITLFILEAEEWAKSWDERAKDPNFVKPSLFGIPVSIKECVSVKGYDHTRGYAQELGNVAEEDAPIVRQIKELGGIPFVLTNVPQSLLTFSCMNPIYGTTTNPFDATRTSGGSSGGESALIAAGGSIIGVGGDVGGSIRMPCHFTGISGIKPSHLRFSSKGSLGSVPGRPLINASDGPMAADIDTCIQFLKLMWTNNWIHNNADFYVPPINWDQELFSSTRPLRIGYYLDDGWFRATPPLQRAVLEAKQRLESMGHTVVPFHPPNLTRAFQLFIGAVSVDGGKYLMNLISNDLPLMEGNEKLVRIYKIPILVQRVIAVLLEFIYPRMAQALRAMPMNTSDLRQIYEDIEKYRESYSKLVRDDHLDAIICPAQVAPAMRHSEPVELFSTASYTGIYNLLDYAAGVVPVTEVIEEDLKQMKDYPNSDPWYQKIHESIKGTVGLPVGVQVVAPPFREEVCLRVLLEIEKSKSGSKKSSISIIDP